MSRASYTRIVTRRTALRSALALVGLGVVAPVAAPSHALEFLKAAVTAGVGGGGPFEGRIYFEPVTLDQVPFTYPMLARDWPEAFAESDRVRDWFASQGFPSWSSGCKGPMNPIL